MSKIELSAGKFTVECWTDSYPLRAELRTTDDADAKVRIEGSELKDLEYVLKRMRTAMRKHCLRPGYAMAHDALELE